MNKMPPALLALIACSIVLTACASGTPTTNGAAQAHAGAVPSFSGPWAADFTSAYRSASSDFERKALADGSISDSEFAEMENRFKTCLTSHQMTFSGFKPGGGYDFHFGGGNSGAANQAADKCSASSGLNTVGSLYFGMLRNPQKLDEATIVAACLVKKGAVPAGYSASDYARDTPTESYPFSNKTTGDKSLDECTSDPLDLLSENQ